MFQQITESRTLGFFVDSIKPPASYLLLPTLLPASRQRMTVCFLVLLQSCSLMCWDTARMNPEADTMMLNLEEPVSTVSLAAAWRALWKP